MIKTFPPAGAAMGDLRAIDGQDLNVSPSIGICIYPSDSRDAKALLAGACVWPSTTSERAILR